MTNRQKNYDLGYKAGYQGQAINNAFASKSQGYADGWDHGNCDRPSFEELSMDVAKEVHSPLS